ncbi:MAG TPA: hypothetical protein VFA10_07920 [Ktedonobacteraceae bacterium]|nr:hypothetical protein [Ktedonobacteraceae bacterium]
MSQPTPTLLIVFLRRDQDEHVRYYLDEILTPAGIGYRLLASQEERMTLDHVAPFAISYQETRFTFALQRPLDASAIDALAQLVTTGLILGIKVLGEIAIGGDGEVFNNLGE